MFKDSTQDADAFTDSSADQSLPSYPQETVRHILLGSLTAVSNTIKLLHKLNYAEPNDWSQPLPTGRPKEVMAILTKKIRVG